MIQKAVSVVIPAYNYGRFIGQAIRSCLGQTYGNVEVIVVDDGSTDDTRSVVSQFGDRVRYYHQENKGVSVARNVGLQQATGDFVCFLDADDYFLPDALESMVNAFSVNEDAGIVIGQSYWKEEHSEEIKLYEGWNRDRVSKKLHKDLLLGNFSLTSPLIRAEIAKRFRFPNHITNGEDVAYYAKLLFCCSAYLLAKPVLVIVRHPDCLHKNIEAIAKQDISLITTLLDDCFYQGAIEDLRKEVTALVFLSLFRSFYIAGRGKEGRKYYLRAVRTQPGCILRFSFLSKYLRSFWKLP